VLQATTTMSGAKRAISIARLADAIDERGFSQRAIREERVVGGVDDFGVRTRSRDLGENREAAQTGIEIRECRAGAAAVML